MLNGPPNQGLVVSRVTTCVDVQPSLASSLQARSPLSLPDPGHRPASAEALACLRGQLTSWPPRYPGTFSVTAGVFPRGGACPAVRRARPQPHDRQLRCSRDCICTLEMIVHRAQDFCFRLTCGKRVTARQYDAQYSERQL
jgi:hypothetical protein